MKKQLSEKHLKVPKRLCITRWSSHADATDALMNGYLIFKELIKQFIENKECYLNVFLKQNGCLINLIIYKRLFLL